MNHTRYFYLSPTTHYPLPGITSLASDIWVLEEPRTRVPHLRDSLIVAKVGIRANARTAPDETRHPNNEPHLVLLSAPNNPLSTTFTTKAAAGIPAG